ncbi:MAG: hypothetical protein LQ345_003540 [Seirophora villosa]|nr:MAG: hypothetical protein LQ345_003540 [Seirophora villosa]
MSLTKNLTASLSRLTVSTLRRQASSTFTFSTRSLCTSSVLRAKDPNMSTGPPKHEMQYFPNMINAMPSESAEFRRVLWTGLYSQVVLMTVPVGGDIGDEVHTVDQALTFTSGVGKATINGKDQDVKAGDLMVVPAGTQHQFVNTGPTPLILYTIYSPAEHDPRTVHKTKEEGDEEEDAGKDEAPKWSRQSQSENEKAGLVNTSGKY